MENAEAKQDTIRIATGMLSGEIDIAVGCRSIQGPLRRLGLESESEFSIFIGVDSETDHLAIGDERQHWSSDGLRKSDAELAATVNHYRPYS